MASAVSPAIAPRPLPRLHVVGDSISMEYGPHLERMLAGIAAYSRKQGRSRDLDRPEGANGGDSGMVLGYLRELQSTATEPFALLLINCGLHDIKIAAGQGGHQVEPAAYRANLVAIAEVARQLARRVAWIRTTQVVEALHDRHSTAFRRRSADVDAYNAIADEVMARAGHAAIDLERFTRSLGGDELVRDHVHFTPATQTLQGAFIAGAAAALLGVPR